MNFREYAKSRKEFIEKSLLSFLKEKSINDFPESINNLSVLEHIKEFSIKGKMLRGILFLFGCEMLGQKIEKKHLHVACAIELVHSALLIHDDIIDNDTLRRGDKTIFAKYIDRGKKIEAGDSSHYGKSMGIIAGDSAFFLAFELLSDFEGKILNKLLKFYANEIYTVALAEGLDSELGQSRKEATIDDILTVYRLKTARYTFSLPLVMAGVSSNSSEEVLSKLEKLGENAGIVFQIKDDELGLFGSEKEIGKPIGSDIRENKKTLIRAFLLEKVTNDEREILNKYFGNPELTQENIDFVVALADKYQIRKKVNEEVDKLMKNVWEEFESLNLDKSYKEILRELLEFNVNRNS